MVNNTFNSLTFIRDDGYVVFNTGRKLYALFKCACGNTKVIAKSMVMTGRTKSCGCLQIAAIKKQGALNKKPAGEAALSCVITSYKAAAKRRNLAFSLSREQFRKLVKQSCVYCGLPPSNSLGKKQLNGDFVYSGLDRQDNTKGYTLKNVVPCCKLCNWAKGTFTHEAFLNWIDRMYFRLHTANDKLVHPSTTLEKSNYFRQASA